MKMKQHRSGVSPKNVGQGFSPAGKADDILNDIYKLTNTIAFIQGSADRAFEELAEKYASRLEPFKTSLKEKEREIIKLMKAEKVSIFDGRDMVRLTNGTLLHSREPKVTIPRDALEKVEELGFKEAIKIVKSLNRDVVKLWPDEKLVLIGAERKTKEKFSYEVKGEGFKGKS